MAETCDICLGTMEPGHDCLGFELGTKINNGLDMMLEEARINPTFENKTMATLSLMINFLIDIRKDLNHLLERAEK